MTAKVVDASALAALLLGEPEPEPEPEAVAERLADAELKAPTLIAYELANVCLIKLRRHPAEKAALKAAFELWTGMDFETIEVDQAAVLDLAEATGLTAYDASYLWLARQLGVELVTLDRQLARAVATP